MSKWSKTREGLTSKKLKNRLRTFLIDFKKFKIIENPKSYFL
jgi:hypothetical protein